MSVFKPNKYFSRDTVISSETVYTITMSHTNGPVEQQLVQFDNIPTGGTWILGMDATPANYSTFGYNADAATIQTALRGLTSITTAWGANLTVTGNYSIGFTIQASQYGNLETLYIDDNLLVYNTSMGGYATNTDGSWSSYSNAQGSPDSVYATKAISPTSTASLLVYFDGVFNSMPAIKPTQWVVTAYHASDTNIYESTNSSNFTASGASTRSFGDNSTPWSTGSNSWSGTNLDGTDGQWGTAYTTIGSLGVTITLRNQDSTYERQATIDAVYLQLYYDTAVTMSISTIING